MTPTPNELPTLSDDDRTELLRIARVTLAEFLTSGFAPPGRPHHAALLCRCGAAVELWRNTTMVGSAVDVEPSAELFQQVVGLVMSAARSVRLEDLPQLRVAVAVLSTPESVDVALPAARAMLRPSVDGVVVTRGPRRGVALPDPRADRIESLLDLAAGRAGLFAGAWTDTHTQVGRFAALRFSE